MKKIRSYFTIAGMTIIVFLTSCATHTGIMMPSAQITNSDFKYLRTESASAGATYFIGIGGLSTEGLVLEAKRDLYRKVDMKRGEVISNVTVDYSTRFYLIIYMRTVTVSADIIQFGGSQNIQEKDISNNKTNVTDQDTVRITKSIDESKPMIDKSQTYDGFYVGEEVHFKVGLKTTYGYVESFDPPKIIVEYQKGVVRQTKTMPSTQVHKVRK